MREFDRTPQPPNNRVMLLGLAAVVGAMAAGGVVAFGLLGAGRGAPHTVAEQLLADNFYSPTGGLYHVADLQARPAVQAVLQRMRSAGYCEFIFKMRTSKTNTNETYLKTCARSLEGRHQWWHDHELGFSEFDLWASGKHRAPFAVLVDAQQQPYLLALGKHGDLGADDVEAMVVGVLDAALARAPAVLEAQRARNADQLRREAERAEGERRAAESFH